MPTASPVIIISAMSSDRVIGAGDGMPWDVPEEYQRYRDTVAAGTVIFGRKSYEIFASDLDADRCICVTRQTDYEAPRVADSLATAIRAAAEDDGPTFVAGGASIYEEALAVADRMYLSVIRGDYAGDTYFPNFNEAEWPVVRREAHEGYEFFEHVRRPIN